MAKPSVFNKQRLRSKISNSASYAEIYISAIILIGIIILSIRVFYDIYGIIGAIINGTTMMPMEDFLADALELIIGIEFIKMLAKHTPSSAVEVLLYAIARKIIGDQGTMVDVLVGVISIAILFLIRKYLSSTIYQSDQNEFIVNSGISVHEINSTIGSSLTAEHGNTAAGIIANIAKQNDEIIEPGYEVEIQGITFQVYSMDSNLIKQIKIVCDSSNNSFNAIKRIMKKGEK